MRIVRSHENFCEIAFSSHKVARRPTHNTHTLETIDHRTTPSSRQNQHPSCVEKKTISLAVVNNIIMSGSRRTGTRAVVLTDKELALLHRGIEWVGFKKKRKNSPKTKTLIRRFKSMFAEGPVAINKLFKDCTAKHPKFKEKYAFMTLQWLCTYAKEVDLAGRYGCCEKTVEKKTREYTKLFQSFKDLKVRFDGFDQRTYQFSVDGQNYDTYEYRMDPSSKWYNHKSHSSGLKYEYAVHLWESRLVSMRGPFPCGVNDLSMYKGGQKGDKKTDKNALYNKVKSEINLNVSLLQKYTSSHTCFCSEMQQTRQFKGFADSGYVSVPNQLTTTRNAHSAKVKDLIKRAKARTESFNSRMSRFNVLKHRFRHGKGTKKRLNLHQSCAEACCVIVHYGMENGSTLFEL